MLMSHVFILFYVMFLLFLYCIVKNYEDYRSIINVWWVLDIMCINRQLTPKYTFTIIIIVFMAIIPRLDESDVYFTSFKERLKK